MRPGAHGNTELKCSPPPNSRLSYHADGLDTVSSLSSWAVYRLQSDGPHPSWSERYSQPPSKEWIKGVNFLMQAPFIPVLSSIQFPAILGDLLHKQDLYIGTQSFEVSTTCHFANCEQANYLRTYQASLIPPGVHWNNHSLGTYFEYQYFSNLSFRFDYQRDFAFESLTCVCS